MWETCANFQAVPASPFLFVASYLFFFNLPNQLLPKPIFFHKRVSPAGRPWPVTKSSLLPIQASNRLHLIFFQAPCKKRLHASTRALFAKNQKLKSLYPHLLEAQRKAGKAAIDLAKLGGIHQNHRISQIPHRLFHHRKTFGDDHLSIDI